MPDPRTALIRRHQGPVWRHLRWLGCDPGAADDLTQEVFVRMLRSPFEERSERETAAFLRRTARNVWREQLRAGRRGLDACGQGDDETWADAATRAFEQAERERDPRLAALSACLDGLEGRKRRALEGYYRERRGHDELGAELGLAAGGVKILLQRCRATLRACIEQRLAMATQGDLR